MRVSPHPPVSSGPLTGVAAAESSAEFSAFYELQARLRSELDKPVLRLIGDLTGVRLQVLWHRPLDDQKPNESPIPCPQARQLASANRGQPARCVACFQQRWKPALAPASQSQPFLGQCGRANLCAGLQAEQLCPLTLVLQTRVAARAASTPHVSRGSAPRIGIKHAGKSVFPAAFDHAVVLVRLLLHDLEATAQARLARSAADHPLPTANPTHLEAARLNGELAHPLAGPPKSTFQAGSNHHARRLVEAMRDYVQAHFSRPLGLNDVASAMNMNASYVSALFSQTTGVTFHRFLEEVRLSKARELLRDPRQRIGEVAEATGYASPDAFRHAFKTHESLSPEAWRARL